MNILSNKFLVERTWYKVVNQQSFYLVFLYITIETIATQGHILQTNPTYANKNSDEILEGERKLKVQLLKTCVGAIPRIIPEGKSLIFVRLKEVYYI